MWGSFKSFFIQEKAVEEENTKKQNESDEDIHDWVLVDLDGNEINKEKGLSLSTTKKSESYLNPLPLLDISNTSSPQSSPQLSPTKIEEGWFVAPPPCFVVDCPTKLEISPLENLLIEHPSMSVYNYVPGFIKDQKLETDLQENLPHAKENCSTATNSLERTKSPSWEIGKVSKRTNFVQKQFDLKSLMDQNVNKTSHYTKQKGKHYTFSPSYISRQNRVYRYESRKHQNQKKKSLAKPFAEKCSKHAF